MHARSSDRRRPAALADSCMAVQHRQSEKCNDLGKSAYRSIRFDSLMHSHKMAPGPGVTAALSIETTERRIECSAREERCWIALNHLRIQRPKPGHDCRGAVAPVIGIVAFEALIVRDISHSTQCHESRIVGHEIPNYETLCATVYAIDSAQLKDPCGVHHVQKKDDPGAGVVFCGDQ